jgi:nucleotide-binding universal stress UspA family protein
VNDIHRIVVSTDFSDASMRAIDRAATLAHSLEASVDLVHVRRRVAWPVSGGIVVTTPRQLEVIYASIDEALAAEAERMLERGIPCVTTSLVGSPPRRLVAHALRTGADLIVVASRRVDSLARSLLGGLASRVLRRAKCPVLVVPT